MLVRPGRIVTISAKSVSLSESLGDPRLKGFSLAPGARFHRLSNAGGAKLPDDSDVKLVHDSDVVRANDRESVGISPECSWYIAWDFHEMRVHLTHYAIMATWLCEWGISGSVDGRDWSSLGERYGETHDCEHTRTDVCFEVGPTERDCAPFRFIRLYPRFNPFSYDRRLRLADIEFFGTLFV
jgi:hypothetical protein